MKQEDLLLSKKYKEIDDELLKCENNIFKVGNKDLNELFLSSMINHEPGEKIYRTKYKLNKIDPFEDLELNNDIFIEEKYLYATYDSKRNTLRKQKTIRRNSEIKENLILNFEEQDGEEDEDEDEKNNKLIIKEKKYNKDSIIQNNKDKNIDIFGMEKIPPDDYLVGNPQIIDIFNFIIKYY